jgi:hypothetical protein
MGADWRQVVLFEQIDKLRELKEDWDSYGGQPITEEAIAAAKDFVGRFKALPTTGGGIAFDVTFGQTNRGGFNIEVMFGSDGSVAEFFQSWEGAYALASQHKDA